MAVQVGQWAQKGKHMDNKEYGKLCLELFKNFPYMTPIQRQYIIESTIGFYCRCCGQRYYECKSVTK